LVVSFLDNLNYFLKIKLELFIMALNS